MQSLQTATAQQAVQARVFMLSEFSTPSRHANGWYPACRALSDFLLSFVLLLLCAPVILIAAALVRITSCGPAFFSQTRLGLGGRTYNIYKLRSMYHESERYSGPLWSVKGDARITPIGRIIRRTHIDELPQLWNVLRGQMSLIGPRPERPEFLDKLQNAVPRYLERLHVRPGVTGLAQVQLPPDSDVADVCRKQAYDLYYIANVSLALDLKILISTPLKVVGISFPLLRKLFVMPSETDVQNHYRGSFPDIDLGPMTLQLPKSADIKPQVQHA